MKGLWKLLSSLKVVRENFFQHKVFKVLPFFLPSEGKFAPRPWLLMAGLRRIHTSGIMQTQVEFLHHLFRGRILNTPHCWPLPLAFLFSSPFCVKLDQRYVVWLSHAQTTEPETWVHIPALDWVLNTNTSHPKGLHRWGVILQCSNCLFWKYSLSSVLNWGFQPLKEWSSRKAFWEEKEGLFWTTKFISFRVLPLNSNNTLQYYISMSTLFETDLILQKEKKSCGSS